VHRVLLNRNAPIRAEIAADKFIVVPWDVNYFSALSTLAKEFLDDIIVFLRPTLLSSPLMVDSRLDDPVRK
jgi:hypothetical protein